ncbi:MAG: hypothetical protein JWM27_4692 [Gemmatimonadetes bacterium]|nr:hypothetical protein [Gemmatimonadota bacterium]
MTESRFELQTSAAGSVPAESPDEGRKPFVAPTVEEMGGLAELTLLGGSL